MKNGQIFPSKFYHFWGNLTTCKEANLPKLINLDCQDSIRFGIFQIAQK